MALPKFWCLLLEPVAVAVCLKAPVLLSNGTTLVVPTEWWRYTARTCKIDYVIIKPYIAKIFINKTLLDQLTIQI